MEPRLRQSDPAGARAVLGVVECRSVKQTATYVQTMLVDGQDRVTAKPPDP